MSYADDLPEDVNQLATMTAKCVCQWDDVADPLDTDWKDFRPYPRTITQITFDWRCKYGNHAARAKKGEQRRIRFLDNGTVQDVQ
jgi:hypothetical protein